ncbi:MAG: acyl-CoA dehydrogenase family protein [bacterium]|nr:acyl-CoA dehydrogenase family protein [bacterium]
MFDLEPDDELALVLETARRLARDELVPPMRTHEAERSISKALSASWDEVGLSTLDVPIELDGAGMGCLARVHLNEALAEGDVGAAIALDPYGPALVALLETGGTDAARTLVEATDGGTRRALYVDARDAVVREDGNRLTLDVAWVAAEDAAALVLVDDAGARLVAEGLSFDPVRGAGLRAAGGARLRLEGAPIAHRFENPDGAARARARARLHTASLLLGILSATCSFSADYAQERQAFGRPIAHHQALAFLITDMRIALDAARLVVHEAAWRVDQGLPCETEAASAWAECIEIARTLGPNGVQILGGHGFMADYPVEKHMREARALSLLHGGFDAAIEDAGRALVATASPLALGQEGAL